MPPPTRFRASELGAQSFNGQCRQAVAKVSQRRALCRLDTLTIPESPKGWTMGDITLQRPSTLRMDAGTWLYQACGALTYFRKTKSRDGHVRVGSPQPFAAPGSKSSRCERWATDHKDRHGLISERPHRLPRERGLGLASVLGARKRGFAKRRALLMNYRARPLDNSSALRSPAQHRPSGRTLAPDEQLANAAVPARARRHTTLNRASDIRWPTACRPAPVAMRPAWPPRRSKAAWST